MPASTPTLGQYLGYWLREGRADPRAEDLRQVRDVLPPEPPPGRGALRLDRLEVRDIRPRLNGLRKICPCSAQGKAAQEALQRLGESLDHTATAAPAAAPTAETAGPVRIPAV